MRVEYSSNNSGGSWWLTDQNWEDLEAAGWKVNWFKDETDRIFKSDEDGRWLGALATSASREGLSLKDAIEEWERVTGRDSTALGCSCCGTPHNFTLYEGEKYVDSYSPEYPTHGSRYGD